MGALIGNKELFVDFPRQCLFTDTHNCKTRGGGDSGPSLLYNPEPFFGTASTY